MVMLYRITGHTLGSHSSFLQAASQELLTVMQYRTTEHTLVSHTSLLQDASWELLIMIGLHRPPQNVLLEALLSISKTMLRGCFSWLCCTTPKDMLEETLLIFCRLLLRNHA